MRLRPDVRDFILSNAEGARGLIERLVDQERRAPADHERIQDLEKQLALLQEQIAAGPTTSNGQSSDKSVPTDTPLTEYGERLREKFRKHHRARMLARRLGLKSDAQFLALGVGYCGTRGAARDESEHKELRKLGLLESNGKERLAGCLTVPFYTAGRLSGFWGCALTSSSEQRTGIGQGLLATGPVGKELVLVDGVFEALAAFGSGITNVQAMELLTPGWLPVLYQAGLRKVFLATSSSEQTQKFAREFTKLGVDCHLIAVPDDRESRVDLLEHPPSWEWALKKATRYKS